MAADDAVKLLLLLSGISPQCQHTKSFSVAARRCGPRRRRFRTSFEATSSPRGEEGEGERGKRERQREK